MDKSGERPSWVGWLEWDCMGQQTSEGFVVYEVVVKIRVEGLLGIVKAREGDKGVVHFVGARGLSGLSGEVRRIIRNDSAKWQVDKYFKS